MSLPKGRGTSIHSTVKTRKNEPLSFLFLPQNTCLIGKNHDNNHFGDFMYFYVYLHMNKKNCLFEIKHLVHRLHAQLQKVLSEGVKH